MTEEKATERCEDIIKKNNKVVKEARKAGDTNAMQLVAELDTESLAIETILNIIKERNKRIKELEEEKKNRVDFQKKYIEVTNLYLNSISKQKIKDKIKELANIKGDFATYIAVSERIKVLEELLELGEGD